MLLPQSSAFATLRNRLHSISPIGMFSSFPRRYIYPFLMDLILVLPIRLPVEIVVQTRLNPTTSNGRNSWINSAQFKFVMKKHDLVNLTLALRP